MEDLPPPPPSSSSGDHLSSSQSSQRLKRPITRSSTARLNAKSPCNNSSSSEEQQQQQCGASSSNHAASSSSAVKQRRGPSGTALPAGDSSALVKSERVDYGPHSSLVSPRPCSTGASANPMSSALTCVLCRDLFREPYSLPCGHSYCHECVLNALTFASKCPTCDREVRNPDAELHPNFSLSSVVDRYFSMTASSTPPLLGVSNCLQLLHNVPDPNQQALQAKEQQNNNNSATGEDLAADMELESSSSSCRQVGHQQSPSLVTRRFSVSSNSGVSMTAAEIDREINRLRSMKAQLELQDEYLENVLVKEFLVNVKTSVEQQMAKLRSKLDKVSSDLDEVNACLRCVVDGHEQVPSSSTVVSSLDAMTPASSIRSMGTHFGDFEELYDRSSPCFDDAPSNARRLASFRRALVQGTRYSGLRSVASIDFAMGTLQRTSCIVSSVAFNSRRDLFALAGVTKEIKVYDYASAINSGGTGAGSSACPLVYPVTRMQNEKNKVSCIAWSPFHAQQLGSTDYDGYVCVWDALRSQIATQWNEHDKRCWTIDWNKAEPDLLATGSDDFKVKIWKLNCEHSVNQIEWARSNVCTVDFHPTSRYYLVFGASDHNLYYFDLRQVRSPVSVMRGHTKAVSYARFLSPNEICSASIDGTLRLWDVSGRSCLRSYSGHTNEMNFVGLDTYSNYIVCGSETNEVFVYYKHLRRPLFTYKFPSEPSLPEPPNSFVSALAWNKSAGVLLAANSQGYAKLLEFEIPSL